MAHVHYWVLDDKGFGVCKCRAKRQFQNRFLDLRDQWSLTFNNSGWPRPPIQLLRTVEDDE